MEVDEVLGTLVCRDIDDMGFIVTEHNAQNALTDLSIESYPIPNECCREADVVHAE